MHCVGSLLWHWGSLLRCTAFFSCSIRAPLVVAVVSCGGVSCPSACGILVPQPRIDLSPLHWKANSQSLDPQGESPSILYITVLFILLCGFSLLIKSRPI